jgi:hypothetical protein
LSRRVAGKPFTGPGGREFETRGGFSGAFSDGEAAGGRAFLACRSAEQLVDGIHPSHVSLLLGIPDSQREIRIHPPLKHGKFSEAGNHAAPVDQLAAGLGATPALHAKPNERGSQKFLHKSEIGHAEEVAGVKGAAFAGHRAGAAAFAAGEALRYLRIPGRPPEMQTAFEKLL